MPKFLVKSGISAFYYQNSEHQTLIINKNKLSKQLALDIDLPGFKKEELSLELKNGYLLIRAAKGLDKDEKEEKTGKFVRRERYAGSMSRSFYVGKGVKQEDVHARYESGVLRLSIPKAEEQKAKIEDRNYIAIEG